MYPLRFYLSFVYAFVCLEIVLGSLAVAMKTEEPNCVVKESELNGRKTFEIRAGRTLEAGAELCLPLNLLNGDYEFPFR